MSQRHQYIGIEALSLTAPQRQTIVQDLQGRGKADGDPSPARRNHWRIRADGNAAIFEAVFEDDELTVLAYRQRLATLFGVSLASITAATQQTASGPVATFTYNAVARLRVIVFGGTSATREQSAAAARQYMADNAAAWEPAA